MTGRILLLWLAASVSLVRGQTDRCWDTKLPGSYGARLDKIAKETDKTQRGDQIRDLTAINLNARCFWQYAVVSSKVDGSQLLPAIVRALEQIRTDKQAGAGAAAQGTTSLVSRGAAAKAFAVAAEYGALTQSVKGQTVTVSGNAGALPTLALKNGLFPYCPDSKDHQCIGRGTLHFLRRISGSVTFDTTRDALTGSGAYQPQPGLPVAARASTNTTDSGAGNSTPVPVTFDASRKQISNVTARVTLWDKRDLVSAEYQSRWLDQVKRSPAYAEAAYAAVVQTGQTIGELANSPVYNEWRKTAVSELESLPQGTVTAEKWKEQLDKLVAAFRADPGLEFDTKLDALRAATQRFDVVSDNVIDDLATAPVLTFEYQNNRPAGQTPISKFRLIGEIGWWGKNNLAANFAVGFYDAAQPPVDGKPTPRWSDIEFGAQYERKLGKLSILGPAALALSQYFQNQRAASILDVDPAQPLPGVTFVHLPDGAKKVFAQPGKIWISQLRLVLGPDKASVRIPVALSWSNRTELIDKPTWRAQIGLNYDLDALFAKTKSASPSGVE